MSKTTRPLPDDYTALLAEVKERVRSAQYEALRAVNKELIALYWDIGKMIVSRQTDASHGAAIVEQLATDLRLEFPGISGFSRRNVFYMREFYLAYCNLSKVQPLVAQIGWSHNLIILQRCKDQLEREFYIRMAKKFGWTKNVLIHQIENQSYEKTLLSQTNFDKTLTPKQRAQAKLTVKDEYTFDFLELGKEHSERELEHALIARIEDFLRAMGGLFALFSARKKIAPLSSMPCTIPASLSVWRLTAWSGSCPKNSMACYPALTKLPNCWRMWNDSVCSSLLNGEDAL